MDISLFQLVIICATIAVVLGFGIRAARSVHSTKGFSVGGRSAGVPLVAGGIAGTCVGGGATVGTAQLAATAGLSAWWFTIGSGVGLIIMGLFYAKQLRRTALETIPQFLAQNFGLTCGVFSSIVSSIGILFSAVASCLPAIYIIAAIFGISFLPATILLVLAVAAYAFFGGMKSAGVGGILKMIVIWSTMAIAGVMAAHHQHVFQLFHLFDDLLQTLVFVDLQPDAAGFASAHRHADDAFHIVGAAGEQPHHMRHHARMVIHVDFQHRASELFCGHG